jgi:hypothetical protein
MKAYALRPRSVEDVWRDLLDAVDSAVFELASLGELEQSAALSRDSSYLEQRAMRHIRNLSKAND